MIIGCCGWSFFRPKLWFGNDWKKRFDSTLQAYASIFDSVEINSTFYRFHMSATGRRWLEDARAINNDFIFTMKAYRGITHDAKFDVKKSMEYVKKTIDFLEAVDGKVLLFQTPKSFGYGEENLKRVKQFFKRYGKDIPVPIAWEPRGTWLEKEEILKELMHELNIFICVDPFRVKPFEQELNYFRLHGLGKPMYRYKFSDDELKRIAKKVKRLKNVYIMFNNYEMYDDALRFKSIVKR